MMIFLLFLCLLLLILILAALLRSSWEQKHFVVRDYVLQTTGLHGGFKAAVIADLHGAVYGEGNEKLIRAIDEAAPDMILIPGDLITCRRSETEAEAPDLSLLRALASRYPVYYAPGNHEENYLQLHPEYAREVADTGAVFLVNEIVKVNPDGYRPVGVTEKASGESLAGNVKKASGESLTGNVKKASGESLTGTMDKVPGESLTGNAKKPFGGNEAEAGPAGRMFVAGLAIGEDYYVRGKQPRMSAEFVKEQLGPCPEGCTILLAHNPGFFPTYAQWGADFVISGHNHGGVIRLPLLGGVISASMHLFDRYDRGIFREGKSTMVLSAGLGMHTIHVRLFNQPELVTVSVRGDS